MIIKIDSQVEKLEGALQIPPGAQRDKEFRCAEQQTDITCRSPGGGPGIAIPGTTDFGYYFGSVVKEPLVH